MHDVAPAFAPVFVTEPAPQVRHAASPVLTVYLPAGQSMQALAAFEPVVPTYLPALQAMHAACEDAATYHPAAHAVHVTPPVPVPVFVIEPAAHVMQSDEEPLPDTYLPASHSIQSEASSLPVMATYFPASQPMQSLAAGPAAVENMEYRPAAQRPEHWLVVPPPVP